MTITTHWFVLATTLAAILSTIAIWAPRKLQLKVLALVCATGFLPLAYMSFNDILSRPKPAQLETLVNGKDDLTVLSSIMREDEAIYLWLQLPDAREPRSFQLPWSEATAKELHKATQEAEDTGTAVKMTQPQEKTEDTQQPVFYAQPQEPPPEKQIEEDEAIVFKAAKSEE